MPEFLDPLKSAKPGRPYSPVVKSGDMFFVSGQSGTDRKTGRLAAGGIKSETKQALLNIVDLLESQGLTKRNIVKSTVFLTRMSDFEEMNAAYLEFFGESFPARTTVAVSALPAPQALVEIEAIASMR